MGKGAGEKGIRWERELEKRGAGRKTEQEIRGSGGRGAGVKAIRWAGGAGRRGAGEKGSR